MNDVVGALIALSEHDGAVGQVFNIGNNEEISIENLALLIKKRSESKSRIVYLSYDMAYQEGFEDMMRRVPDISKIGALINYKPSLGIEGILKTVINDMKKKGCR